MRVGSCHTLTCSLTIRIYCKMLGCGCHTGIFLKAFYHLYSEFRHEIWILTVDFLITSPSLVTSHIENGSIYIGIAKKPCLLSGDTAHISDKILVPGASEAELGREIRSHICFHSPDSLVGKINRNTKTGILDKESLDFIQCPCMRACRPDIRTLCGQRCIPSHKRIQMLVYSSYAVLPYRLLPLRGRKLILQHTTIAVESDHLTGLFLQSHLTQQVFYAGIDIGFRIFIDVLDTVLVEIDPVLVVDLRGLHRGNRKEGSQN